jgi:hypothetical protein
VERGDGVGEEEDRATGTTPVKVRRGAEEDERGTTVRSRLHGGFFSLSFCKLRIAERCTTQENVYIKISEAEIVNDYPILAYYEPANQEMDESTDLSHHPLPLLELLRRSQDASKQQPPLEKWSEVLGLSRRRGPRDDAGEGTSRG